MPSSLPATELLESFIALKSQASMRCFVEYSVVLMLFALWFVLKFILFELCDLLMVVEVERSLAAGLVTSLSRYCGTMSCSNVQQTFKMFDFMTPVLFQ